MSHSHPEYLVGKSNGTGESCSKPCISILGNKNKMSIASG